jgi:hypothetical protein
MTQAMPVNSAPITPPRQSDYSELEQQVFEVASTHATEIDQNQNAELTWHEMRDWAQAHGDDLSDGLKGLLLAEKPAGFSWQKVAEDTGSQLQTGRSGVDYYTFDYDPEARTGAPTLPGGEAGTARFKLPDISEDDVDNPGVTVSELLGGRASDVDEGDLIGIAITGTTPGNGTWQISTDGGTTWKGVGSVSEASALGLGPKDRLRFQPDEKNGGEARLTFRAWSPEAGETGGKVDASDNGGSTRFSAQTGEAIINVKDVNDAPVLGSGEQNHAPVLNPGGGSR